MQIQIDHNKAEQLLAKSLKERIHKADEISVLIKKVILGSHKTYGTTKLCVEKII